MTSPEQTRLPTPGQLSAMVSSTALDLPDHRKATIDAILRAGCFPLAMEHGTATAGSSAIQFSLDMVDKADIYIGIFGHRYGYAPDDHSANPNGWSVTEFEYRRAIGRNMPICIFIMTDDHPITAKDVDREAAKIAKLESLKKELRTKHVCGFFDSALKLHSLVIQSLHEEKAKCKANDPSKPRGDIDTSLARILHCSPIYPHQSVRRPTRRTGPH